MSMGMLSFTAVLAAYATASCVVPREFARIKPDKWARHMHYVLNVPGDPVDSHGEGWIKVKPSKSRPKPKKK